MKKIVIVRVVVMINAKDELLQGIVEAEQFSSTVKCAVIGYCSNSYGSFLPDDAESLIDGIVENPLAPCWVRDIEGDNVTIFRETAILKENWSNGDWLRLLYALNFNYDDGFGRQMIFGFVWFKDGSWLERYEYDGSESWVYKKTPTIPDLLKGGV